MFHRGQNKQINNKIINVAISRVNTKGMERKKNRFQRLWMKKGKIIPVVIGTLGPILQCFLKGLGIETEIPGA